MQALLSGTHLYSLKTCLSEGDLQCNSMGEKKKDAFVVANYLKGKKPSSNWR